MPTACDRAHPFIFPIRQSQGDGTSPGYADGMSRRGYAHGNSSHEEQRICGLPPKGYPLNLLAMRSGTPWRWSFARKASVRCLINGICILPSVLGAQPDEASRGKMVSSRVSGPQPLCRVVGGAVTDTLPRRLWIQSKNTLMPS
jgi:hypothetical protein